ncbi:hypothetical protein F7O63_03350 [Neisseria meningitidis]|nr:hypothetical protein [Neisseria meningitidis]
MTASVCRLQHGFFRFYVLDSRLRGNDESIHTETCTTSFLRTYIPSFPRKWESRTQNLKKPFYPISFRTDRPRFPPARE